MQLTKLKHERARRRLTQVEAAKLAGIPQPRWSAIERGIGVRYPTAKRIADALNVPVEELEGPQDTVTPQDMVTITLPRNMLSLINR
jgi:transcriptional regulator with XRE-family HTH domain